jgi:protein-disulfide isomerase
MSEHQSEKKSFFEGVHPKTAFWLGIGGGAGVLITIGFFVLLGVLISQWTGGGRGSVVDKLRAADNPTIAKDLRDTFNEPQGLQEIRLAPVTKDDWIKGNRNAKITIVEYSDTECPFCKRHHPTMQRVIEEYKGDVSWVYRHFPLTSLHRKAQKEAEATECAGELGGNDGFWKYIDRLFEITPSNDGLDEQELPKIAEYVGLNRQKFEKCLESGKYSQKVQAQAQSAVEAGGQGTPYNIIVTDDQKIPVSGAVPFEQIKAIIDSLL